MAGEPVADLRSLQRENALYGKDIESYCLRVSDGVAKCIDMHSTSLSELTWEEQLKGHIQRAGDLAVASHRSAAALWGLRGFDRAQLEISVPRARNPRSRGGLIVHRSSDLALVMPPVLLEEIPTTPVERTLLDLCAVAKRAKVERAINDAQRRGLVDWYGLLQTAKTHARRGRNGMGLFHAILRDRIPDD